LDVYTLFVHTSTRAMASLRSSALLPQCTSCIRRVTRQNLEVWGPQQTRSISKKAKEAERNIVVKLLKDVPRFGRAGTKIFYVAIQLHATGLHNFSDLCDMLTLKRLIHPTQPISHAQSMVPRTCRQLCPRYPDEATEDPGGGYGARFHIRCTAEPGRG
jgi:hypothetical protein